MFILIQKLFTILPDDFRRKYIMVVGLVAVGALFEMIGLSLLFPILALVANPETVLANSFVIASLEYLGQSDSNILIVVAGVVFVVGNIIRIGFSVFVLWKQSTFLEKFVAWLSTKMFAGYLDDSYSYHLQHNSALMLRNVTSEANLVSAAIKNTIDIIAEISVVLAISALLMAVDAFSFLGVAGLLGLCAFGFYRATSRRITYWGRKREESENARFKHVQEAFGGVKEIKILHLENSEKNAYEPVIAITAKANQRNAFMQSMPRFWLETLFVTAIGSFVALNILQEKSMDVLVPILGLFGAAAFRLMPSMNRILSAFQGIRFSAAAIENIVSENTRFHQRRLECSPSSQHLQKISFTNLISVRNLSYAYPMSSTLALDNVNIDIKKGEFIGFIGTSGAGKSTLIDVLLGLLKSSSGEILVDNQPIKDNLFGWQHIIGYVPQSLYLTDSTLRRNIAFGVPEDQIDECAVMRAVQLAQLQEFVAELPLGLDSTVGERGVRISGGQRQRIGIARALYRNTPILLLDEATSALDIETEEILMEKIYKMRGEKTVLIVAHRLTTLKKCDHIYRLANGKVVSSGSVDTVLGDSLN